MPENFRYGRCLNIKHCNQADNSEHIRIADDAEFVCPECGRSLVDIVPFGKKAKKVDSDKKPAPPRYLMLLFVFVVTMIIFGAVFGLYGPLHRSADQDADSDSSGAPAQTIFRVGSALGEQSVLTPALVADFLRRQDCSDVTAVTDVAGNPRLRCDTAAGPLAVTMVAMADPLDALARRTIDVALTNTPITTAQVGKMLSQGNMASAGNERIIAYDALSVIVHPSNPLRRLSEPQLAALLAGQSLETRVLAPANGTHADALVRTLVPGGIGTAVERMANSAQVAAAITADPKAIGIVETAASKGARTIAIGPTGGVALVPGPMNIASRDYRLMRPVYLYRTGDTSRAEAHAFVDFLGSRQAMQTITAAGLSAADLVRQAVPAAAGAPPAYIARIAHAKRLSTTVRFRPGTIDITSVDKTALADLAARLLKEKVPGKRIMLLAFTDASANAAVESDGMARSVANSLADLGLRPGTVQGFGAALPLTDVPTPDARNHNRRVEIWIAP